MRRKLTRASLRELASTMKIISTDSQETMVGCGNGTFHDPFTYGEHQIYNGDSSLPVFYYDNGGLLCCDYPEVLVAGQYTGSSGYFGGSDIRTYLYHFMEENSISDETLTKGGQFASSFSINASVKEAIINLAKNSEGFDGACKSYLNFTKCFGKVLGGVGVGFTLLQAIKDSSTKNWIKVGISVTALALGPWGTAVYSTLELSGTVDHIAEVISKHIDSISFYKE